MFLAALKGYERPCFDKWKFYPLAYNLEETQNCVDFFEQFEVPEDNNIDWIAKVSHNSHNAEGIELVTKKYGEKLIEKYGD